MTRKMLRLTLWLIGGLAATLLAVVVGAWFYTQTDHFRILLREQALAALRDSVDGEVTFERLDGSIWSQLHFHKISIRQNGNEVISIPKLSLKFSLIRQALSFLVSSSLHVGSIEMSEPVVKLVQDENKQWNIASLFKSADAPEEPRRVAVFLDQLKIDNGRIDAQLADGKTMNLTSLSGEGNLALLYSGIKADVAALNFSLTSEGIPPVQWSSAFSWQAIDSGALLDLRGLSLRTAGSQMRLAGEIRDLGKVNVALKVELNRIAASEMRMLLPALPLHQDLSGLIKISGPRSALRANGNFRFYDGYLDTWVLADLTESEPRLQGTVDAKDFLIGKVLSIPGLAGNLNGRLSFQGTSLKSARASTRASVSGLVVKNWQLGDLDLSANLRDQAIALNTKLRSKNGQALLDGQIALGNQPAYQAALRVRQLDVRNMTKTISVPMTGEINLDAQVQGRGTDPSTLDGSANITLLPSKIGAVEALQGKIIGTLRQRILTLNEARLMSRDTTLSTQGKISTVAKGPSGKITYVVRAKEIAPWLALAGVEGKGGLHLDGNATGSLKALNLEGKANFSQIKVAGSSFQSGSAVWNLAGIGSSRPNGSARIATRDVQAGIPLRAVDVDLSLDGIEPMKIQANLVAEDREKHNHRLRVQGRYATEQIDGVVEQLALHAPNGIWRTAQPVNFRVKEKRITINDLQLQRATQSLRINGTFGLQGNQDLQVQVKRFPLEDLRPFLGADPGVEGEMSAEMELRGSAVSPVLKSRLSVDGLSIAGQRYAGLSGEAFYQNERLAVDMILRQDASHYLTAKGGLPVYLGWGGQKSVAVLGEADLRIHSDGLSPAFLALASKEIENIKGNLVLDVRLHGPADALRPTGTVELQQTQGRVKRSGLLVTRVDVQAQLVPGAIQVTRISAHSGEGQLTGGGKIALKNYSLGAIDLTLNTEGFQVVNTPEYNAAVSGPLTASGSPQQLFVRGALTVENAKLRPNLAALRQKGPAPPDPTIVVVKNEEELAKIEKETREKKTGPRGAENSSQNGFYQRLGLDITVVVPRGTWVYVDEGSVELMGRLRIRKDPKGEVSLTGTLESVRGWYSFHGKKFRVEKAQIVFTGGGDIDPSLDVIARYKLPQYEIDLVIGGTTKKPTLTLRSNPAMEQADILSVLLFGAPVARLSEGQQASLQTQALKTTANFVASDLRQSVARRLGLDNLEFEFGKDVSEPRIGVGKYVTQDVFVSASQQFGGDRQQEYVVEYNIAPNWQLKSSTTAQGKSGIDLFWRKQY